MQMFSKNLIKHFRAHDLMLQNISIGYTVAWENRMMASIKKRRISSAFYRLGREYIFLNFHNIKHIAYLYNRSIAHQAGMKINHGKSVLHSLISA